MAKSIKAIHCPRCGSADKKDLGNDRFQCTSCDTEYFLDDDYTHVVHHHKNYQQPVIPQQNKKALLIIIPVFIILSTIFFFSIFSSTKSSKSNTESISEEKKLTDKKLVIAKTKDNKLLFTLIGVEITGSYPDYKEKLVAYFYDQNANEIKKQEINYNLSKTTGFPFTQHYMSNGDVYIIYDNKTLFKVDADVMTVTELKSDWFNHPELASGIAKIEKMYDQDGFKVLTQEGKTFAIMPLTNQLIPANDIYNSAKIIPANATVKTCYAFTILPLEIKKLLIYTQKQQNGYLTDEPYFDMNEQMKPYIRSQVAGLIDYKLLSERAFFAPKLLGNNNDMVFISTKTDASVNSPYKLQALNAKNGDVIWTTELISNKSHMKYEVFNVAFNNKQLFVEGNLGGMVINLKDGKIVSKLNL